MLGKISYKIAKMMHWDFHRSYFGETKEASGERVAVLEILCGSVS